MGFISGAITEHLKLDVFTQTFDGFVYGNSFLIMPSEMARFEN